MESKDRLRDGFYGSKSDLEAMMKALLDLLITRDDVTIRDNARKTHPLDASSSASHGEETFSKRPQSFLRYLNPHFFIDSEDVIVKTRWDILDIVTFCPRQSTLNCIL
jgi:hypothetical protein